MSAGTLLPTPGTQGLESVRRALGFVPSQLEAWAGIGNGLLTVASEEFRSGFAGRDVHRELMATLDVERQMAGRDAVNQSQYVWAKTMLPNYILSNLGDRMENVVILTMSEFGRMARENGNGGTDHGHAGAMFAIGGSIRGGKVHGKWPGLAPEQLYEGRDLALTTDFRAVFSEIAGKHLGAVKLDRVFPGYTTGGAVGLL